MIHAQPQLARLSPGTYLRDCRAAAGVTLEDVVAMMRVIRRADLEADFALMLGMIEGDMVRATAEHLMALRLTFEFRPALYRQLALEADTPLPLQERTFAHG